MVTFRSGERSRSTAFRWRVRSRLLTPRRGGCTPQGCIYLRSRPDAGDRALGGATPLLFVRAVVRTVPPGPAGDPIGRPAHERERCRLGIIALEHHRREGTGCQDRAAGAFDSPPV